jgi:hypothetical protein
LQTHQAVHFQVFPIRTGISIPNNQMPASEQIATPAKSGFAMTALFRQVFAF